MLTKTQSGARRPAFLDTLIPEQTTKPLEPVPSWSPEGRTRSILTALEALPKLTAAIGMSASAPDAQVEVLPGHPTTIAFTAGGQLKGLVVVPVGEHETRRLLGLEPPPRRDRHADQLWEETRRQDFETAPLS